MADLSAQFHKSYRLTTAQIIYHLPDHDSLLQEFIWQNYDLAPQFPELKKFLKFWEISIEGRLHSVYVAHTKLFHPAITGLPTGKAHYSNADFP
ncbi:MAG: usg protein [Alphaproteobacteria bacterium]|nr:usg protein [Alphaproteobacteria bacterium]